MTWTGSFAKSPARIETQAIVTTSRIAVICEMTMPDAEVEPPFSQSRNHGSGFLASDDFSRSASAMRDHTDIRPPIGSDEPDFAAVGINFLFDLTVQRSAQRHDYRGQAVDAPGGFRLVRH